MKNRNINLIALFIILVMFTASAMAQKARLDQPAPNFTLTDANGKAHSLSDYKGKFVVLEWVNFDCPFVKKHYRSGNMPKLQKEYREKGVVWLSICSSAEGKQGHYTGKALLERMKSENAAPTAYLLDTEGTVGKMYGAKTTPHMFVINPEGQLIYAGGIDDKPSTNQEDIATAKNYVVAALNAAMRGKEVAQKSAQPYGCSVKY
ncbi:MAG: thioredoxin family protein [Calditrichia bacterium]